MKKILISLIILIFVMAAICGGLVFAYTKSADYNGDTFNDSYVVNGIDCSGLTYDEAAEKLTQQWNQKTLTITDTNDKKLASFSNFGCTYDFKNSLKTLKKDNLILSAANHYLNMQASVDVPMTVTERSDKFKARVLASEFLKPEGKIVQTKDAYVDTDDPKYPIIKEVYGNNVDGDKFFDAIIDSISAGTFTYKYDYEKFIESPKVVSDDEKLLEYQKFCKQRFKQKITYKLGKETFTIPASELAKMLARDTSGAVDKKGVRKYVASLEKKYNTVGIRRTIKTLRGETVTISGGTEGWTIDPKGEAAQLKKDLESGKDVERKPVYKHEGYGTYTRTVGKTYVEVDFTEQKVFLFINGKCKFKCEVVTGDKSKGKSTPEGLWYIKNKIRNVTMRGTNADGTKYEVPAKYWMGVTPNGIGLHDSNWRTEFGGDIWKTNGSHGCINMPKWLIADMFKQVKVGMPVLMHY